METLRETGGTAYVAAGGGCDLCKAAVSQLQEQTNHRFLGHFSEPRSLQELAKKASRENGVLLLLHSDGLFGAEEIRKLKAKQADLRLLVVGPKEMLIEGHTLLAAGSDGLVVCSDPLTEWSAALSAMIKRDIFVSPALLANVLERLLDAGGFPGRSGVEALTNREYAVFELVGSGFRTAEIARRLGVSSKTVESHREKIKHRLGLPDSASLTRFAVSFAQKHTIVAPQSHTRPHRK